MRPVFDGGIVQFHLDVGLSFLAVKVACSILPHGPCAQSLREWDPDQAKDDSGIAPGCMLVMKAKVSVHLRFEIHAANWYLYPFILLFVLFFQVWAMGPYIHRYVDKKYIYIYTHIHRHTLIWYVRCRYVYTCVHVLHIYICVYIYEHVVVNGLQIRGS